MKPYWRVATLALLMAMALPGQNPIRLKTGAIDTRGPREDQRSLQLRTLRERRHWIVQFRSYPGPALHDELAARGILVLEYVPDFALAVSATGVPDLAGLDVNWVGALLPNDKISPALRRGEYQQYLASFQLDADMERARDTVNRAGLEVVETAGLLPRHLMLAGPPDRLQALAADDDVAYIVPADWELRLHRPHYRCPGPMVAAGPVADYALNGTGWAKDAAGNVALGYFFQTLPAKLDANTVRSEIGRAFTEWERYANLSFATAARQGMERSIDILFATGPHGDNYPFISASLLAHTFFPSPPNLEPVAGDMHLNDAEDWQVGRDVDLFSVALHEIGHALGLAHSDDPTAVMYPYYKMATGLSGDDIAAVQALYGARGATAPAPPSTPAPPPPPPPPAPNPPPVTPSGADQTPPTLTIVSPSATIVSVYAPSIALSGTATDNVGVTRVEWSNSNGGSAQASGTSGWSATVPLLVGDNVITLKAYDAAGNSAWRSITVVRH